MSVVETTSLSMLYSFVKTYITLFGILNLIVGYDFMRWNEKRGLGKKPTYFTKICADLQLFAAVSFSLFAYQEVCAYYGFTYPLVSLFENVDAIFLMALKVAAVVLSSVVAHSAYLLKPRSNDVLIAYLKERLSGVAISSVIAMV